MLPVRGTGNSTSANVAPSSDQALLDHRAARTGVRPEHGVYDCSVARERDARIASASFVPVVRLQNAASAP